MRRICTELCSLIHLCLLASQASAVPPLEPDQIREIQQELNDVVRRHKTQGISLTLVSSQDLFLQVNAGFRDISRQEAMTADSLFGAGSLSKSMTGLLFGKMVEDGKIRMDEKLSSFFPGLPRPLAQLTLHQLLSQTTGYPEFFGKTSLLASLVNENSEPAVIQDTWQSLLDFLERGKEFRLSPPEKTFTYNNDFFTLLGRIIELRTGESFEEVVRREIFEKASLSKTSYARERVFKNPDRVSGYFKNDGEWKKGKFPFSRIGEASGGMWSTTRELGNLLQAILLSQTSSENNLVQPKTLKKIWTPYSRVEWGYINLPIILNMAGNTFF